MKVLFFAAGGDFALFPIQAVAAHHRICGVVRPALRGGLRGLARGGARLMGLRPLDTINPWLRKRDIPRLVAESPNDPELDAFVRSMSPDIICIATLPWIVPEAILQLAPLGALNLHGSLLPRHRGPNPFFWTYYHGDPETGVTVHEATARVDSGPILGRQTFPLPRGFSISSLHTQLARLGAEELVRTLEAIEIGESYPTPQDERAATPAPRVAKGTPMTQFNEWEVSQVWHFLAGLFPHFQEPLRDTRGRPARYRGVGPFEKGEPRHPPGTAEPVRGGWLLHCRGGFISLAS